MKNSIFLELGVPQVIVDSLADVEIYEPFRIQQMTLPLALTGNDVIGQAKTGTGKTLGFGIPLLARLSVIATPDEPRVKSPEALVIVPTRELCVQVSRDLAAAAKRAGVKVAAIYGGRAAEPQIAELKAGVDVVVGTPGRLLDLAGQRVLDLSKVRTLVLDEADEMLDMGFLPDVERLVAQIPANRQTMLFSATMPSQIVALARRYMSQPTHVQADDPTDDNATVAAIEQHAWRVHGMDKTELIARVLQANNRGLVIIFAKTKRTCQRIADDLTERGFAVGAVHGDLGQAAREQALRAFRSGKVDVLVATDVAARGIDIDGVTHVINYSCPDDEKVYLHRVGRTGRAGQDGVAITFVDWEDTARWQMINRALGLPFPHPIETYSTSPHVFTGLNIPEGTTGTLPKAARTREGLAAEEIEDIEAKSSGRGSKKGRTGGTSRSRSPRASGGRTRNTGSAGKAAGEQAESADQSQTGNSRPRRQRKRTRGGQTDATANPSNDSAAAAAKSTESAASSDENPNNLGAEPARKRKRTRRRSDSKAASSSSTANNGDTAAAE